MRKSSLPIAVAALTASFAAFASAQVTHFSSSLSQVGSNALINGDIQKVFTTNGTTAFSERTLSNVDGTAHGKALSDLSTGALKALGTVTSTPTGGSIMGFARADFGDSFRAVSGNSPFTWSAGDVATFNLDVSGAVTRAGTGDRKNYSQMGITILEPGALDAYARWLRDDDASAFSEWASRRTAFYYWDLASDQPINNEQVTSFPFSDSFSFTPGEDFDWVLTLIADTNVNGPFASTDASVSADFYNTAVISYAGPAGTTTQSASGAFPGTVAIPEPATVGLLVFVSTTIARRRRSTR